MKYFVSKLKKIIILVVCFEVLITGIPSNAKAASFIEDVMTWGDNFTNDGREQAMKDDAASDENTSKITTALYNILLTIGIVVTIGVGGALGIKFMTASAGDKAKVKESMIPYAVGSVAIFGSLMIWKLVIGILSKL